MTDVAVKPNSSLRASSRRGMVYFSSPVQSSVMRLFMGSQSAARSVGAFLLRLGLAKIGGANWEGASEIEMDALST